MCFLIFSARVTFFCLVIDQTQLPPLGCRYRWCFSLVYLLGGIEKSSETKIYYEGCWWAVFLQTQSLGENAATRWSPNGMTAPSVCDWATGGWFFGCLLSLLCFLFCSARHALSSFELTCQNLRPLRREFGPSMNRRSQKDLRMPLCLSACAILTTIS